MKSRYSVAILAVLVILSALAINGRGAPKDNPVQVTAVPHFQMADVRVLITRGSQITAIKIRFMCSMRVVSFRRR